MTLRPWPKPTPSRKVLPTGPKAKGGSAFPKMRDKAFTTWLRTENPCFLRGHWMRASVSPRDSLSPAVVEWRWLHQCFGPRDPAHVNQTRAQGVPDFGETIPLCRAAHRFLDSHTRFEFLRVTGISQAQLASAASGYALKFVELGGQPVVTHTKHPR